MNLVNRSIESCKWIGLVGVINGLTERFSMLQDNRGYLSLNRLPGHLRTGRSKAKTHFQVWPIVCTSPYVSPLCEHKATGLLGKKPGLLWSYITYTVTDEPPGGRAWLFDGSLLTISFGTIVSAENYVTLKWNVHICVSQAGIIYSTWISLW